MCPLSLARMQFPGRTVDCKHVQCFDIQVMCKSLLSACSSSSAICDLLLGTLSPGSQKMPNCPVCGIPISLSALKVDNLFKELVDTFPLTIESIRISRDDGDNWIILPANSSLPPAIEVVDLTLTPDLDYSDDCTDWVAIKTEESVQVESKAFQPLPEVPLSSSSPSGNDGIRTNLRPLFAPACTQDHLPNMPPICPVPVTWHSTPVELERGPSAPPTQIVVESESESDTQYDGISDESNFHASDFSFDRDYDEDEDDDQDALTSMYHATGFVDQFESQILLSLSDGFTTEPIGHSFRPIRLRHASFNNHGLDGDNHDLGRHRNFSSGNPIQLRCQSVPKQKQQKRLLFQDGKDRPHQQETGWKLPNFTGLQPMQKRARLPDSRAPSHTAASGHHRPGFSFEDPIIID